jgi:ABC-type polysaccharide/polyol phosphate transport system ATPase subunit
MMTIITSEKIQKIYRLYSKPSDKLKEIILRRPFHKEFTALNNITFSVKRGETLGVIGENGAGKSTLLKILSRTLTPTSGHFEVKGKVSSLLELGTGFHPEFSGIDNIYFYGSLLGLDNNFMRKKIDEIIAFSELGEFINYPIRTYSSGMHVRLAFSVATAVDPDILIIDEALSVGDQYFQKKCLEKMADFKRNGKTIVFCSHDTYQIKTFCDNTLWLHHGEVKMHGNASDVINSYNSYELMKIGNRRTDDIKIPDANGSKSSFLFINDLSVVQNRKTGMIIHFKVRSLEPFEGHLGWAILRKDKLEIAFATTKMQGKESILFGDASRDISIAVENLNINSGCYLVFVGIFDKNAYSPIAIEAIECNLDTGYDILNSVCFFNSIFTIH